MYICTASSETMPFYQNYYSREIKAYAGDDWRYVILDRFNTRTYLLLAAMVILYILSEILSFVSLFFIYKALSLNSSKLSKRTYKLQQQLIRLLFIQVINPIIFIVLPMTAGIFCVFLNMKVNMFMAETGMLLASIYPCFNAVFTVIFITPYYEFTKCWIKKYILCNSDRNITLSSPPITTNIVTDDFVSYFPRNLNHSRSLPPNHSL
uniref:G protein-coupled receptor n=1 Tax=Panagrolaimus sp. JU765 TaxID=591449 RepID=A0AC34RQA7_9BILA